MVFLQHKLVSRSFDVRQRYFFLFFSFISDCLMVSASNITEYFNFFSFQMPWFFLDLVVLFFLLFAFFHFSLWGWHIFLFQILFLYTGHMLFLFVSVSNYFFSILVNRWMQSLTWGNFLLIDGFSLSHRVIDLSLWFSKFVNPWALLGNVIEWYHRDYK